MELKRIKNEICIKVYEVHFSYETFKGRYKTQIRKIKAINKQHAIECFEEWKKTVRTMTNVDMLAIVQSNEKVEVIEL